MGGFDMKDILELKIDGILSGLNVTADEERKLVFERKFENGFWKLVSDVLGRHEGEPEIPNPDKDYARWV